MAEFYKIKINNLDSKNSTERIRKLSLKKYNHCADLNTICTHRFSCSGNIFISLIK